MAAFLTPLKRHLVVPAAVLVAASAAAPVRAADGVPHGSGHRGGQSQEGRATPGEAAGSPAVSTSPSAVEMRTLQYASPGRAVRRGAQVSSLPIATRQISPHWTWNGQAMDVDRYMEGAKVSGVIVLRDGAVVLERYGLGRTQEDLWDSESVTKSITAILVGAAIQDGYIKSMDDEVVSYIPELKGSAYDGVSIRHLLTMTSGVQLTGGELSSDAWSNPKSAVRQAWSGPVVDGLDPAVAVMRRLPRSHQPGTVFDYKSAEADIAGLLVSKAVGRSASEYLSEKIWRPFGMERDAFWPVNSAGHVHGGGCIMMTLRDYARVGQFMLAGGQASGKQVTPANWVADASSPHVSFPAPDYRGAVGYGYFWWVIKDGYKATGSYGQTIVVFPKDKVVIAINSIWADDGPERRQEQNAFVEALHAAALAQPLGAVRD